MKKDFKDFNKDFKRSFTKKGFTFVEILVVVTIIGVLTTVGAVSYRSANVKSRDGKRKADLEQIRAALEMCRTDTGSYPSGLSFGGSLTCGGNTYLNPIPQDPLSPNYNYRYNRLTATTYCLCAQLEGSNPGTNCNCGENYCSSSACNYSTQNP
ncbi:MAG: prepilin-type N-terminal cleavage/methylation domain-containing protein [Candidatus Omnitrophica bacterium]|nr:prepilin-type N-terminal cleavage/methylation domain-containing protein [Candidatus Omnitrophota bacterium]